MKLKLILIPVMILLIPLVVFASPNSDLFGNATRIIHFDDGSSFTYDNKTGTTGTPTNTPSFSTTKVQVGAGSSNYNDGDFLTYNLLANESTALGAETVCMWMSVDNTAGGSYNAISRLGGGFGGDWAIYLEGGTENVGINWFGGGDPQLQVVMLASGASGVTLQHYCFVYNQSGGTAWITTYHNGTQANEGSIGRGVPDQPADALVIGGNGLVGNVDEFVSFNRSLTSDQIKLLYDLGVNGTPLVADEPFVPDTTPPTLNIPAPENNTAISDNLINFTVNTTDAEALSIICELRNETELLDVGTTTTGVMFNLTYDSGKTSIQQKNIYTITCFDNSPSINNSVSVFLNITLDNVLPVLTITFPANNSVIDKTFNNITLDASCTDQNIIALNVSLVDADGNLLFSMQNNTPVSSEMAFDTEIDIINFAVGTHRLNFTCADGHTYYDSKVDYFVKDELLSKLYYGTKSGNDISIEMFYSSLALCDFGSRSASDREIFWYDFESCNKEASGQQTYKFMLRDNYNQLKYLPKSEYRGHFITTENFATFHLSSPATYSIKKFGKDYEVAIYTKETFLDFKNSIGGNNFVRRFLDLEITETNFTSVTHFDFTAPDMVIDSSSFVPLMNLTFNISTGFHFLFRGSGMVEKLTLPQSTAVSGRLTVNNEILFTGQLVSTADFLSFNLPLGHSDMAVGQNNITLEVSEDGNGAINISRFRLEADTDVTPEGNEINHTHGNLTVNLASTTFVKVFEIFINKTFNSSTFIDIQHRFENTQSEAITSFCYAENNATGEQTPTYYGYMAVNGASDNSGIAYASKIRPASHEKWEIFCRNSLANTVSNRITSILLDMTDNVGKVIQTFQNVSTTPSGITAGDTLLMTVENFQPFNSSQTHIITTVAVQTTSGTHATPLRIKVNSSDLEESNCTGFSRTGFVDASDTKTLKFYMDCENENKIPIDIQLYATVATGETATIINVSLMGYEVEEELSFAENIPPMVVITAPIASTVFQEVGEIKWVITDEDEFVINVTAINSTDTAGIASGLASSVANTSFNFSTLGEGIFLINVTAFETISNERFTGTDTVSIIVRFPTINITLFRPANNSVDIDGLVTFQFITDTTGANCSLHIDNTINFINQSLNSTAGTNTYEPVRLDNATHTWLVRCRNESLTGVSGQFNLNVLIADPFALSLTVCPNTVAGAMVLIFIFMIAIIFIVIGLIWRIGIIGFIGAIILIISSWFISPCSNIIAYIIALSGVVMLFVAVFRGFSSNLPIKY